MAILIAIGVNNEGERQILGAAEGLKEDKESWKSFLIWLRDRGLSGVRLIVGEKVESIPEVFPEAKYQSCTVHFYRNVLSAVPRSKIKYVAKMLKAIHASESQKAAREKANQVTQELRSIRLTKAAKNRRWHRRNIPLSKFIGMNKKDLRFPFMKYEIGKVFRDGPIKLGRKREFNR